MFVTNTFFTSEKFVKCMTELFSFDKFMFQMYLPEVLNSQKEYMLISNVHETFIVVNCSPRTQNLYILTIQLFCRYHVIINGLLKD